jgi:hypothetical protein
MVYADIKKLEAAAAAKTLALLRANAEAWSQTKDGAIVLTREDFDKFKQSIIDEIGRE